MRLRLSVVFVIVAFCFVAAGCEPEIERPPAEAEVSGGVAIESLEENIVVEAASEDADKASLTEVQPLLDCIAASMYDTDILSYSDMDAEFQWRAVYYMTTGPFRTTDTDEIHSIDDVTQFVSGGFIEDTVYPSIFAEGALPEYNDSVENISVNGSDFHMTIIPLDEIPEFSAKEYYVDSNGNLVITGTVVSAHTDKKMSVLSSIVLTSDDNAKCGFTVVDFY